MTLQIALRYHAAVNPAQRDHLRRAAYHGVPRASLRDAASSGGRAAFQLEPIFTFRSAATIANAKALEMSNSATPADSSVLTLRTPKWTVRMLGGLALEGENTVIDRFPTQKTGLLLAMLALSPGRWRLRDELADALWPDADLVSGRSRLSQALAWLRKQFEPAGETRESVLIADRRAVSLRAEAVRSDASEFRASIAAARRAAQAPDIQCAFRRAVNAYAGPFLPHSYDDWALEARREFHESYMDALLALASTARDQANLEEALSLCRRAVAADPLREEAHGELIRCLALAGRPGEALRQFDRLRSLLESELNAAPSSATIELVDSLRKAPSGLAIAQPAVSPRPLPSPLSRFFGREAELQRIAEFLEGGDPRLVTLVGLSGIGKTRVAIEAARRISDGRRPLAFVAASGLKRPEELAPAIADALRLPQSQNSPFEQIIDALHGQRSLLILDDVEHLAPEARDVVSGLLESLPQLAVLATSRRRLDVPGECEVSVLPLPGPEAAAGDRWELSPAVQLLLDRIRLVQPEFEHDIQNQDAIRALCEELEGIPLALELCAAWAHTLAPSQMLEKLGRRFELLISRRSDAVARHRSLRAAFEYSYAQLPPRCQDLFVRLSVFRGGWSLEAAEALSGRDGSQGVDALDGLTELRERSLIDTETVGGQMRYRMLESLRQFAIQQRAAGELSAIRHSHASYFLSLARRAEASATGPDQRHWAAILDCDRQNILAAVEWLHQTGQKSAGLELCSAICTYFRGNGRAAQCAQLLEQFMVNAGESAREPQGVAARVWARALVSLGYLRWSLGRHDDAVAVLEKALAACRAIGDRDGAADALFHLGITFHRVQRMDRAWSCLQESLALATQRGNKPAIARVPMILGNIALQQERYQDAQVYLCDALRLQRELGNRRRSAVALCNLANLAHQRGDCGQAHALFQEAIDIAQEVGDAFNLARIYRFHGACVGAGGDYASAWKLLTRATELVRQTGDRHLLRAVVREIAVIALACGQPARAAYLMAAADTAPDDEARRLSPRDRETLVCLQAALRRSLDPASQTAARSAAELSTVEEIVAQACSGPESADFALSLPAGGDDNPAASCPHCGAIRLIRYGLTAAGSRRLQCAACGRVAADTAKQQVERTNRKQKILWAYRNDGLSQRELARIYGVARKTLTKWINEAPASWRPAGRTDQHEGNQGAAFSSVRSS